MSKHLTRIYKLVTKVCVQRFMESVAVKSPNFPREAMGISTQFIILVLFLHYYECRASDVPYYNRRLPTFVNLVRSHGYYGESYHILTEDDYILRIDRISGGPYSRPARGKPVVLFQHGILASSETFVFWDPKNSLSYLLVDAGYDVWVSNFRGNTNCRAHRTLSPDDHRFWNFTIDDLGTKDLPAAIDFALKRTGQSCLTYIGHSMGTTASYMLLSGRPEYIKKISFLVSLAPVVLWNYNVAGVIRPILAGAVDAMKVILNAPDYAVEILGQGSYVQEFLKNQCFDQTSILCKLFIDTFLAHAESPEQLMPESIKVLLQYTPAGTSLKILNHYKQMAYSGSFRRYDHGTRKNLELYGRMEPPRYDVRKVTCKVALFWVNNDILAHQLNVRLLARNLPNVVAAEPVRSDHFRHADFLFFRNAKALIYDRIIQLVNKHHQCQIPK